ncbi:protein of unknown function [Hyunsoonleella jejuensis]|uniref:DUF4270 domain-containing protein n=1 Tax=Hyunsoonleella jejuensis TaxID=419940 RepID=A0A1H9BKX2_9FLAO|nr:DUF4270 domain-containing protein [Hyunsoonleella jejuensis]SEP89640.1 protein of unknown function [Hyunsoonleella jejuensis]
MKKTIKALNCSFAILFIFFVSVSCDTEYNSIESDVLSEDNFNFNAEQIEYPIKTYNRNLSGQQINGLTSNLLGFFNDPTYGETTGSIVTQVIPSSFATNTSEMFGVNPVIESVTLTIPYFSTQTSVDTDGKPTYKLDSLYVENNDPANIKPIKITVYENNYFLRNFNPNDPESNSQNYYSKADGQINSTDNFAQTENTVINFEDHIGQLFCDSIFTVSSAPREIKNGTGTDEVTSYLPPALELNLATSDTSKARWKSLILDQAGLPALSNANNFFNHFRGLYIKTDAINNEGSMVLLNLADSGAIITINYSSDDDDDDDTDRETGSYVLNFNGNRVNTFINNYNTNILPTTPDTSNGDEKLYLKGTEGSMAIIELFSGLVDCDGDGQVDDDALECFKKTFRKTDENGNFIEINEQFQLKRLINEAHLVINEDETIENTEDPNGDEYHAYDRLYIYNLENNSPILDYNSDLTAEASNPLMSRRFSLGTRIVDEQGNAKYKLKVTDLLNNILARDLDNTKLGLVVTNNVNINLNSSIIDSDSEVTGVPATAVITPRGTVLHGSNSNDDTKKLRLEIFFTEAK